MMEFETINYRGFDIEIYIGDRFESPREWDNLGTMVYKNRKYILGDEEIDDPIEWLESMLGLEPKYEYSNERLAELENIFYREYIAIPVYKYEHSGITIKACSPFGCRFDSGKCGYIYASKETVRKKFSVKKISEKLRDQVCQILIDEVKTFDMYITGEIYSYISEVGSCGGFYGDEGKKQMIEEAKDEIDAHIKNERFNHYKRVKAFVRNSVPLDKRDPLPVEFSF